MTATLETSLRAIACEIAGAAIPPAEIVVSPLGTVRSTNGDFILGVPEARAIIRAFEAQGNDLPVDWEHETISGRRAPAAGYVTGLRVDPGRGLVAAVRWNAEGASDIAGRRYRYVSPVFMLDKRTLRALELHSIALTNKPAIQRMQPVVNSDRRGMSMDAKYDKLLGRLRALTGQGDDAQEDVILAALVNAPGDTDGLKMMVCSAAGIDPKTVAGDTAFIAAVQKLCAEHAELKCQAFIDMGMDGGKISAFTEPKWRALYLANRMEAESLLGMAPEQFPKPGRMVAPMTTGFGGSTNRGVVIASALREWRNERVLQRMVDLRGHVQGELAEVGLQPLTDEEAARLPAR